MLSWEITRPGGQDRQQGPSWDQQQHRRFSTLISSTAGRPGGQDRQQGPGPGAGIIPKIFYTYQHRRKARKNRRKAYVSRQHTFSPAFTEGRPGARISTEDFLHLSAAPKNRRKAYVSRPRGRNRAAAHLFPYLHRRKAQEGPGIKAQGPKIIPKIFYIEPKIFYIVGGRFFT